jgi:hypothetical protein
MRNKIGLILAIIITLFWTADALAGVNMQEGLWEITTQMEMPGMPMQMPPMTHTQCITKKNMVPQKPKNNECQLIQSNIKGNTVYWTIKCESNEGIIVSKGKVTYRGNTFDGTIETTINDPSQGKMKMTNHIKGRRIGECP